MPLLTLPLTVDSFSDPVLGEPIAFAQCALLPGSDTPLTLPVYTMPSGLAYMPGQSLVETVMASAASSRPEGWSSDTARIADIAREGPFDAYASPMDTEDSHLVTTGLPGCLYRITSYKTVISFTNVLGGSARRRECYGGSSQLTEGRWHYVVKFFRSLLRRCIECRRR